MVNKFSIIQIKDVDDYQVTLLVYLSDLVLYEEIERQFFL